MSENKNRSNRENYDKNKREKYVKRKRDQFLQNNIDESEFEQPKIYKKRKINVEEQTIKCGSTQFTNKKSKNSTETTESLNSLLTSNAKKRKIDPKLLPEKNTINAIIKPNLKRTRDEEEDFDVSHKQKILKLNINKNPFVMATNAIKTNVVGGVN